MSENVKFVVYEYTEKAGEYRGCRFYSQYSGEDAIDNSGHTIVVAKDVDENVAVSLVNEVIDLNMLTYSFEMAKLLAKLDDIRKERFLNFC
jgi:hypothetical protein